MGRKILFGCKRLLGCRTSFARKRLLGRKRLLCGAQGQSYRYAIRFAAPCAGAPGARGRCVRRKAQATRPAVPAMRQCWVSARRQGLLTNWQNGGGSCCSVMATGALAHYSRCCSVTIQLQLDASGGAHVADHGPSRQCAQPQAGRRGLLHRMCRYGRRQGWRWRRGRGRAGGGAVGREGRGAGRWRGRSRRNLRGPPRDACHTAGSRVLLVSGNKRQVDKHCTSHLVCKHRTR